MNVLVTGASGQLGFDVIKELRNRGIDCCGISFQSESEFIGLDITDSFEVNSFFDFVKPDVVIHCAAWTNVDLAEDEDKKEAVFALNLKGTENIVDACDKHGAKLIFISTDYVFDGEGKEPWKIEDKCNPINVYGTSKYEAEKVVSERLEKFFIVRISWLFGSHGKNFVKTMLRIAKDRDEVNVVCDQYGTPTYSVDLAKVLADMAESDRYGYYHVSNSEDEEGYISWYDFCVEIYKQSGVDITVNPVTSDEFIQAKARRPKNSRLDKSKLTENGFKILPTWKDALGRYLKEIENGTD